MIKLPDEILSKIFTYISSDTADIIKPYIKSYEVYSSWFSPRYDRMPFDEYMMTNAMYLDFTSKRHLRDRSQSLKLYISWSMLDTNF